MSGFIVWFSKYQNGLLDNLNHFFIVFFGLIGNKCYLCSAKTKKQYCNEEEIIAYSASF